MNRRQFLTAMLGVAIVAAIALTGCDDVLAEIQKGLGPSESAASKTELPSIAAGGNGISASVGEGFTTDKDTFAEVVTQMDADAGTQSETYTLPGLGDQGDRYMTDLTLTTANSPYSVVIDGRRNESQTGWVVTGNGNSITIGADITLTLKNITFKNISFTVSDGGTLILDDGAVVTGNTGTGVTVTGTLEMRDGSSVTQNGNSGVRINGTDGVFTMRGGTISDNTVPVITGADIGGAGVAMWGANSKFTMSDGTISGNTVPIITGAEDTGGGGGIAMYGTNSKFTMSGGTISGNSAMWGGGVELYGGRAVFTMEDGTISDNNSSNDGGGVDVDGESATFTMLDGVIKDNKAKYNGGGVYVYNTTFNMEGGEITGNDAGGWGGAPGIGGVVAPTIGGNPQIGGTTPPASGGWIHGNTDVDV